MCAKYVPDPQAGCPTDTPPGADPNLRPENRNFGPGYEHVCVLSCESGAPCQANATCQKPMPGEPAEYGSFCSYHAPVLA